MTDPRGYELNADASADASDDIEDLAPSDAPNDIRGGDGKVPEPPKEQVSLQYGSIELQYTPQTN